MLQSMRLNIPSSKDLICILTLSASLHGTGELRFYCLSPFYCLPPFLDGGRSQLDQASCLLITTVCTFLSRLDLCTLPFGPCFHIHPVQPPCEVQTLRYHEQECQKHMSRFSLWITSLKYYYSQNISRVFSLLTSQLYEEKFVLARAERSGGNVFFPVVFPLHWRLLLLFTCLKRKCFPTLPVCTVGTQSGQCVSYSTRVLLHFIL